jgi:hypothetical protein
MNGYIATVSWKCEMTEEARQAIHVVGARSMEEGLEIAKRAEFSRWGSGMRRGVRWSIVAIPENNAWCVSRS